MSETRIMKEIEDIYNDLPDNVITGPINDMIFIIGQQDQKNQKIQIIKMVYFYIKYSIPKEYPLEFNEILKY